MKNNFTVAFEYTVGHEGGYTTNPKDRGNWTTGIIGKGELKGTKYGVSAMSYPNEDIKNLTLDRAKFLYRRDYWDKVRGDILPAGLDFLVFDIAVNHGVRDAIVFMQHGVGATADGVIGPKTINAATTCNVKEAILEVSARRGVDYANIKSFNTFGLGWMRRLTATTAQALEMYKDHVVSSVASTLDQSKEGDEGEDRYIWGNLFRRVNE